MACRSSPCCSWGIEGTGLVGRLVEAAEERARSTRSAEWRIFGTVSVVNLLTTHSTVALITVGGFARAMGKRFGIGRYRRANILDVGVCEAYGMPRIGPVTAGLANAHAWALLVMLLFALITGWGRGRSAGAAGAGASSTSAAQPVDDGQRHGGGE